MEIWDLYDKDGNVTGETWERKSGNYLAIPDGRYHLVCDIMVAHRDGTFLLCLRHPDKDVYPGFWEAGAGGSAVKGETPEECARRELFEETGIKAGELELLGRHVRDRSHSIVYCYVTYTDCDKDSVVLQEGETVDYKWVDARGLIEYADSDVCIKSSVERYKAFYDKVRESLQK